MGKNNCYYFFDAKAYFEMTNNVFPFLAATLKASSTIFSKVCGRQDGCIEFVF